MRNDQWAGLELRHLAALEALVEEGSFRRAAARLGYVASAVSQQISGLEAVVGQRVVERSRGGGSVRLTPAGELVLGHARAILSRLRAAEADLAALAEGASALLRLGITESVGVRVLPTLLRSFAEAWPAVRLRPTEASSDLALYAALAHGDLDLSFVELPAPEGPFATVEILSDPYVLVVASESPLAGRRLELVELAGVPLVGHTRCRGLARVEEQLRAQGLEPEFAFRSEVNATIQALAGAGVGAAVLPALAVDPTNEQTATAELAGIPPRRLALARHRDRYQPAAAQAFVALALAVCDAIARERLLGTLSG